MLVLQRISHTYPGSGRPVLDEIDEQFAAGEQILLRGVSGSGKTTLLNIVAGLLTPTSGEVTIAGQALYRLDEARRDRTRGRLIGYVLQNHHLLNSLTALENVEMPMAFAGVAAAERRRQARGLLERLGLGDVVGKSPQRLSTGQRQRIAIARALANGPRVVLADEPTSALDAESAAQALDMLQDTLREQEGVLLVASHDPALESRFGTLLDLRHGKLHRASHKSIHAESAHAAV